MRNTMLSPRVSLSVILLAVVAAGCAKSEQGSADTTAAAASGAPSSTSDTGMAGMSSSTMAGMNRGAAKDADQEFLRMMTDHHQGMIQMGSDAMTKGSTPAVQGDAHKMHTAQMDEQNKMIGMLKTNYGETTMPMLMPSNKSMMEMMQTKTGAGYDRAFYESVIAHHGQAIKMVDDMMPKLTNAEVKKMAQQMKADQVKEIAELKKKVK